MPFMILGCDRGHVDVDILDEGWAVSLFTLRQSEMAASVEKAAGELVYRCEFDTYDGALVRAYATALTFNSEMVERRPFAYCVDKTPDVIAFNLLVGMTREASKELMACVPEVEATLSNGRVLFDLRQSQEDRAGLKIWFERSEKMLSAALKRQVQNVLDQYERIPLLDPGRPKGSLHPGVGGE